MPDQNDELEGSDNQADPGEHAAEGPQDAEEPAGADDAGEKAAERGSADSSEEVTPEQGPTDDADLMPMPLENRQVLGELVVHYASRDVTLLLDGEAAVRMLTMFARRREGGLGDHLHPQLSSARAGWVVLDLGEPLAMSWMPGLPTRQPRTVIDPAIPNAA